MREQDSMSTPPSSVKFSPDQWSLQRWKCDRKLSKRDMLNQQPPFGEDASWNSVAPIGLSLSPPSTSRQPNINCTSGLLTLWAVPPIASKQRKKPARWGIKVLPNMLSPDKFKTNKGLGKELLPIGSARIITTYLLKVVCIIEFSGMLEKGTSSYRLTVPKLTKWLVLQIQYILLPLILIPGVYVTSKNTRRQNVWSDTLFFFSRWQSA